MEILGYGEDALTLWALKNKLPTILHTLRDWSDPSLCQVFFRPSFGRRGGENRAEFGEFDFILMTDNSIYLGESKWHRSSEQLRSGVLVLRGEQIARHKMFKFYVEEWIVGNHQSWPNFESAAKAKLQSQAKLQSRKVTKLIASEGSLLAANLQVLLEIVKRRYANLPPIRDVLLFLHPGINASLIPQKAAKDFEVVAIDYSEATLGNFIRLF